MINSDIQIFLNDTRTNLRPPVIYDGKDTLCRFLQEHFGIKNLVFISTYTVEARIDCIMRDDIAYVVYDFMAVSYFDDLISSEKNYFPIQELVTHIAALDRYINGQPEKSFAWIALSQLRYSGVAAHTRHTFANLDFHSWLMLGYTIAHELSHIAFSLNTEIKSKYFSLSSKLLEESVEPHGLNDVLVYDENGVSGFCRFDVRSSEDLSLEEVACDIAAFDAIEIFVRDKIFDEEGNNFRERTLPYLVRRMFKYYALQDFLRSLQGIFDSDSKAWIDIRNSKVEFDNSLQVRWACLRSHAARPGVGIDLGQQDNVLSSAALMIGYAKEVFANGPASGIDSCADLILGLSDDIRPNIEALVSKFIMLRDNALK